MFIKIEFILIRKFQGSEEDGTEGELSNHDSYHNNGTSDSPYEDYNYKARFVHFSTVVNICIMIAHVHTKYDLLSIRFMK